MAPLCHNLLPPMVVSVGVVWLLCVDFVMEMKMKFGEVEELMEVEWGLWMEVSGFW